MKKSVALMLGEMQKKMSGYAVLLNYRFMNLCVKAEPASLMPVTVPVNGEDMDIEEVADVAIPQENQLEVYPKDSSLLFAISKAIHEAHPEFKIEERSRNDESGESEGGDEEDKSILCTMPVVDKDRYDLYMNGVSTLSDEVKVKLDSNHVLYGNKIAAKLMGASVEEIDEAKKMLEEIYNGHVDLCKEYRENKEKEIEDAYQLYLSEQSQKEAAAQEEEAARGETAGSAMKMMGGEE